MQGYVPTFFYSGVEVNLLFVTGTDTGVGKTFVSSLLLRHFLRHGIAAGYQKWVSTGTAGRSEDLASCLGTAGLPSEPHLAALQTPYCFGLAASPHLAARLEAKEIDPDHLLDCTKRLAKHFDVLIVEGVGGCLVPLRPDLILADLLAILRPPTLIVARSGLGTINHTLLTIEALRSRDIPVLGVVFSDETVLENSIIAEDNMLTISALGKIPVFGRMRRASSAQEADQAFAGIGEKIRASLTSPGALPFGRDDVVT